MQWRLNDQKVYSAGSFIFHRRNFSEKSIKKFLNIMPKKLRDANLEKFKSKKFRLTLDL
jgi:hypothetical protein